MKMSEAEAHDNGNFRQGQRQKLQRMRALSEMW